MNETGIDEQGRLRGTTAPLGVTRPVLIYSSGCRFCRWAARFITRLDRGEQLALLPQTHERARCLLVNVPERTRAGSWWIIGRDGIPVAGNDGGGVALLTELRSTRWLGQALRAIGLSSFIDVLDGVVARYRGRLSRLVPDGPAPHRYP